MLGVSRANPAVGRVVPGLPWSIAGSTPGPLIASAVRCQ